MQIIISCRAKERIIIVQNIEYLSERDLKYFEKKEALGEAIIIRIEPEALLSLDLDALFQDRPKDQTLSAEELESFLQGNPSATRQKEPASVRVGRYSPPRVGLNQPFRVGKKKPILGQQKIANNHIKSLRFHSYRIN